MAILENPKPLNPKHMHHFLNGISLLFNPLETQELYFKNQAQHESYWLTALAYLSQAYHVEQEKRTTEPDRTLGLLFFE